MCACASVGAFVCCFLVLYLALVIVSLLVRWFLCLMSAFFVCLFVGMIVVVVFFLCLCFCVCLRLIYFTCFFVMLMCRLFMLCLGLMFVCCLLDCLWSCLLLWLDDVCEGLCMFVCSCFLFLIVSVFLRCNAPFSFVRFLLVFANSFVGLCVVVFVWLFACVLCFAWCCFFVVVSLC